MNALHADFLAEACPLAIANAAIGSVQCATSRCAGRGHRARLERLARSGRSASPATRARRERASRSSARAHPPGARGFFFFTDSTNDERTAVHDRFPHATRDRDRRSCKPAQRRAGKQAVSEHGKPESTPP